MTKDKEWLKAEIKEAIEIELSHDFGLKSGEYISLYTLENLIDQLDVPEVPQFVADWFEENKDNLENSIYSLCLDVHLRNESSMCTWFDNNTNKPIETLSKMKDAGYTITKISTLPTDKDYSDNVPLTLDWVKFDRESYEKVKAFVGSKLSPITIPRCINGVASCMLEEDKCFMTIREGDFVVKTNDGRFKKTSPGLIKQLKDLTE